MPLLVGSTNMRHDVKESLAPSSLLKQLRVATDMLATVLPALERANLDADFLEALAELYPSCEAFYFQN